VNAMFGDIVKVTPTSKVVGDMAIMMVTSGLTPEAVRDPEVDVAFPESVVQLFRGELGQPAGGFPAELQKKVLGGRQPLTVRAGELFAPSDLEGERARAEAQIGRAVSDFDLASYLMYPKVFTEYAASRASYGDVSTLPTSVFFYGMQTGQEINIDLERGKTLILKYVATSDVHEDGTRTVFFELNGQPRPIRVADRSQVAKRPPRRKVEAGNAKHVGAPMPGTIGTVSVRVGQSLARGDTLLTLEAMKMETTVRAEQDGAIKEVLAKPGQPVDAKDLLVVFE
jgi:pyruvate carboxylase